MRFRYLPLFLVGVLLACLSTEVMGQWSVDEVQQFKQDHPGARFYGLPFHNHEGADDEAKTFSAIYGTQLATGSTPLDSAWNLINEVQDMLGADVGGFLPAMKPTGEVLQGVMFNRETGKHKFYTFRFDQLYQGVPVFRSGVGFLVRNEPGNPLVMSGFDVKDLVGFDVGRTGEAQVSNKMLQNVRKLMDEQPVPRSLLKPAPPLDIEVSDERLVVFAGSNNVAAEPQLAVSFIAQRGSIQTLPDYQKYLIVAAVDGGDLLLSETQIHNVDVVGNVSGRATDGVGALECHPETAVGLPYAEVSISGGNTAFADANGNYTIPHGGSGAVTVTSRLRGQWFEVFDQAAGGAIPQISTVVTPPGPANFLHNPAPSTELSNANVNGYYEANQCRDYVLFYEPTFPTIATQTFFDVNTNIASTCNAFYDGNSINFYQAGGGCNNTSMADVIYHEYGHHLINVTGNGQGQMGEGSGDCVGVLMQDEPILAHGFSGNCGAGIRNANNNHQYPCSGAIHDCGQLLSGCVWDTRNELILTEPSDYRDIGAALFFGMLIVRGQMQPGNSTIDPSITVMYLELDDDDANIGNGTPHYQEIAIGFGKHNMDAPPLDLLQFDYPSGRPNLISPGGGVAFTVQVSALNANPQSGTGVLHVDRGAGFEAFPMTEQSPNLYEANFPTSDCGIELKYYVTADTTSADTVSDPPLAPNEFFTAISGGTATPTFLDDFETNQGWTVSGSATDGQWDRGVPVGGGDRGDPPTDADGSGQCYLTDNVDGNSDVDGGSTTLTSPIMNATTGAGEEAVLTYHRWYNNVAGNAPEEDIFVVEISNNGGSSWVNLETVGPTGPEVTGGWHKRSFRISDTIAPTSQMRVRFTASDLINGSIVEAGVDGVEMQIIGCEETVVPLAFNVILGSVDTGGVPELLNSDDQYLVLDPEFLANRWQLMFTVDATSPTDSPSQLTFNLESRTANFVGLIDQRVELFNYTTGQFEQIDTRNTTAADSVTTVTPGGDPTRFVQPGTGAMQARIRCQNGVPWWIVDLTNIFLPFKTRVDQVFWNITP